MAESKKIKSGKKEFEYRGISLEELKKLDVREFAKYVKSRKRRTLLRQFSEIEDFLTRARKKIEKNKPIRTHKRHIIIVPEMVGMKLHVHNGRKFEPFEVVVEMLGHRFGEFSLTRSLVKHGAAGVGATKGSKALSKA